MDVRLLGPFEVVTQDGVADIGSGKRRALLAYLVIHANEVVPAERLIDELWGARPPTTAAKSVQVYVSQLRKALRANGELLVTRGSGYVLNVDDGDLDVKRFERSLAEARRALEAGDTRRAADRAAAALEMWRGPALYDVAYESFAQNEAARLEELRLTALETRIEARLGLAEHGELVGELESLVAEHPLRDRFRVQLMLALYRSGRQSEALAIYRDGRRVLDELGLEPTPELRELERQILLHSPELGAPDRARRRQAALVAPRGRDRARHGPRLLVAGSLVLALVLGVVVLKQPAGAPAPLPAVQSTACSPVIYGGSGRPDALIVASTALQGALSVNGVQTEQALKLALGERRWRAGATRIGLQVCDETTAASDASNLARCRANAQAIARIRAVLAVIGPFQSTCTAEMLPIVRTATGGPIPVVGVSATFLGLTREGPGVASGEPDIYDPGGRRNFIRVVPADDVQGAAAAMYVKRDGAQRAVVLQDGVPYGNGLAASFKTAAQRIGLNVVGVFEWRTPAGDYRDLSARARRAKADAVFLGGAAQENGPRLIADLRAALPHARLIGPDGMSQAAVLSEGAGSAAEGFLSTVAAVPPTRLPKAGRLFAQRFRRLYGDYPAFYAVNSAQAAQMLLDAIAAAGPDRTRITAKLLGAHVSGGLIGDFDIDRFGDTSLTRMGLYRIELGRNKFVTSLWPPATLLDRK